MFATMLPPAATSPAPAAEEIALRQIAGPREVVLRLHDPAGDPGAEAYVVEADDVVGPAGGKAAIASVVTFTGPMSPAVKQAADRAERDRIGPEMAAHATSTVRVLRLWQPERRRKVVVVMTVDQPALESGFRRITTMELLPGEDPALLPGPDHVEIFEVSS